MDCLATREFYFASRVRMRVGGDGSVQSGKWLQTCVRNKLFFPFSTWLLSFPAVPCEREQLTASGLSECDSQGDANCANCISGQLVAGQKSMDFRLYDGTFRPSPSGGYY